MPPRNSAGRIVPAQLDFFALYNPSLGTNDDNLGQQIVYFSSPATSDSSETGTRKSSSKNSTSEVSHEENNERLRQIGLAQGMVEFGKSFSSGQSVDSIETEKSRIILHELESGWWILASISLTRRPLSSEGSTTDKKSDSATTEYSSREVKPAALLLQDLTRAHYIFLLHHASSMSALFVRTKRIKFMNLLGRYWDAFLDTWDVLLHGNPAVNIYGGIKLAACGELGVGVGEEERGSGEREVLEGFIGRVEGLVDLIVCKFGDAVPDEESEQSVSQTTAQKMAQPIQPWLGTGEEPGAEDGAIFLGTGALSRKSLRDVANWVEDVYRWGPNAYGVLVNPSSSRRVKDVPSGKQDASRNKHVDRVSTAGSGNGPQSSPRDEQSSLSTIVDMTGPLEKITEEQNSVERAKEDNASVHSTDTVTSKTSITTTKRRFRPNLSRNRSSKSSSKSTRTVSTGDPTAANKFVTFLKLGYGTHWTLGLGSGDENGSASNTTADHGGIPARVTDLVPQAVAIPAQPGEAQAPAKAHDSVYPINDSIPHYLVGLLGELDSGKNSNDELTETITEVEDDMASRRTLVRTVTVELERREDLRPEADVSIDLSTGDGHHTSMISAGTSQHTMESASRSGNGWDSQDLNKTKKLRVVVYVQRPFIYTFFFELRTESLAWATLYQSLHSQVGPLLKPLLTSTKHSLSRPDISNTATGTATAPIYDLIWNPGLLTVMSSIPNIPSPEESGQLWSRIEALNTHSQVLNTYIATRGDTTELERTSKTSRGWWVVWARIPEVISASVDVPNVESSALGQQHLTPPAVTPRFRREVSTVTHSTINSTASGPAHPFLEVPATPKFVPLDKEIFLIRQASDHVSSRMVSAGIAGDSWKFGETWGTAPAKLAQGIGVDTKRYIEGLLSMG